MVVYPASKVIWADTVWKPLRAALAPLDIHIKAGWLDWALQDCDDKTADHWQAHWRDNILPDVLGCDTLLFLSLAGERACSGLIELGVALAHSKPVLCVSPDWWSFSHLPNVRRFAALEPAIECLVNTAAGQQARAA